MRVYGILEFTTLDDEIPPSIAFSGAFDGFSPWIYGHNVMVGCTLGNVMVGSSRHGYTDKGKGRKMD